tara:strand:+ start:744 stop:2201 length:1458 start_codon:yes stop_codon:yes gene_type:complete
MRLRELLYKVNIIKICGNNDVEVLDINFDSRKIKQGGLFVAIKGENVDSHNYIQDTILKGARVIVAEILPNILDENITYVQVKNSKQALGFIASSFYKHPSEKIKLIGVTGTNGKTTIVTLLYQLFSLLKVKVGMLSTIENRIEDTVIPSTHTTPDALQINYLLHKMVKAGCEYCFMEVSSHSVSQQRISGLHFTAGIFSNITKDHLDYHKTFDQYIEAKKMFFDFLSEDAFAMINLDDKNASKMIEHTQAKCFSYSLKSASDYKCKILENQFDGMLLNINNLDIWVKLIGRFNAYNILALYATAIELGFSEHDLLTALSMLDTVKGRFECVQFSGVKAIVDYAHTEDALKNVLMTINDIRKQKESLITVLGCGGDRDKQKRPLMSAIACKLSDQVIITSDNPRSEDPESIIQDMLNGLDLQQKKKVLTITDRRQAIRAACKLAKSHDIILVAGKGHEKYQEIKGVKIPFDDLKELEYTFNLNTQ